MTCRICHKNERIFVNGQLVCPNCDHIKLRTKTQILKDLQKKLENYLRNFKQISKKSDLSVSIQVILKYRETAAKALIDNPEDENAVDIWISSLYTLANLPEKGQGDRSIKPNALLEAGKRIAKTMSMITLIVQNRIVILENGQSCYTELQPLFHTSEDVNRKIFEEQGFTELSPQARILEQMMKAHMTEHLTMVESETLNRKLRFYYPKYLLPYKQTELIKIFEKIAFYVSFQVSGALSTNFQSNVGLYVLDSLRYDMFKNQMIETYGDYSSKILSTKGPVRNGENLGLRLFIEDSERNEVSMPYYSLILLTKIIYKWIHSTPEYSKRLGEEPEDWIYNIVKGYLDTTSPINGKRLIRYKLGKKKPEIDVIGYNDCKIVLIESKFWESSNVSSLEEELTKFEKRVTFFNENKIQYGFSEKQEIIPIFYFPWPPFTKYGSLGIMLVPSLSAIIWFLLTNFPPRRRSLVKATDKIIEFLKNDNEERLFMTDLSDYLEVEPDMYTIQDVQVDEINENEITVFSYVAIGFAAPFIFDLDDDVLEELKKQGVKHGSLLRACTYNLRGYWGDIQLVAFKILSVEGLFSPNEILAVKNPREYDRFLAATFGPELSQELLDFTKRRKISLQRYMRWAEDSGHNVFMAVGTLLARGDIPGTVLSQCDCGEVTNMQNEIYSEFVKKYGQNVKCKNCDPGLKNKIEGIVGSNVFQMEGKEFFLK